MDRGADPRAVSGHGSRVLPPGMPAAYCTLVPRLSITVTHFPSGPCMSILNVCAVGDSSMITTRV